MNGRNEKGDAPAQGQLAIDPWKDVEFMTDRIAATAQRMAQAQLGRGARVVLMMLPPLDGESIEREVHASSTLNRAETVRILREFVDSLDPNGDGFGGLGVGGRVGRFRLIAMDD